MCNATPRCCPPPRQNLKMSKANARHRRSVFIGVLALGSLVWAAHDQFGIPPENIGWMLVYTIAAVFSIIVLAATVVALWLGLRKLLGRS